MADTEPSDAKLSPRARSLALWLSDLANPVFNARDREASAAMLLADLPDHWCEVDLLRLADGIRREHGPKASHRTWLSAAGWLVGEDERLPPRPAQRLTGYARMRAERQIAAILAKLTGGDSEVSA